MNKTRFINAKRRSFMQRSVIVGSAAATGAVAVETQAEETPASQAPNQKVSAGYQLTDKVKEYYRKARF